MKMRKISLLWRSKDYFDDEEKFDNEGVLKVDTPNGTTFGDGGNPGWGSQIPGGGF